MMKAEKLGYAGYVGMKILLSIVSAIALGIAALVVVLALLIPLALAGVIVVVVGRSIGLVWNVLTISLAITAGCIALAAMLFGVLLAAVPTVVFFPAYSIYFFADRYPPLKAALRLPS